MNKDYKLWIETVTIFHVVITLVSISAMFLIFLYQPLRIHSAIWLAGLWLIEASHGFKCPLTTHEYKLRVKAGEKLERENFIPKAFKKYLRVTIPDWAGNAIVTVYFFISAFILVRYFL